jgi:hypothetical protein
MRSGSDGTHAVLYGYDAIGPSAVRFPRSASETELASAQAKHVEKITLTPEGRTYIATGTWDLLGSLAVRMVPGARIAP